MIGSTLQRGRWGEGVAMRHLLHKHYRIVEKNWRMGRGELDIVARDGDVTVFVEVKTRSRDDRIGAYGAARQPRKKKMLLQTGEAYVQKYSDSICTYRWDVIEILTPRNTNQADAIYHFENVSIAS
ncbi:MAG: YraN family protein [Puniceicoccales bacterium]|nr:YraN family protein [Puniceicoccales bacterium]